MIPARGRSAAAGRPRQRVGMLRGHLQRKAGAGVPGFAPGTAGVTVLIIAHRLDTVAHAYQVVQLADGRVVRAAVEVA